MCRCGLDLTTTLCVQVYSGRGQRSDPEVPDGASGPQQREHRGLQQQEVLAPRRSHEADEARRQPVSPLPRRGVFLKTLSLAGTAFASLRGLMGVEVEESFSKWKLPEKGG